MFPISRKKEFSESGRRFCDSVCVCVCADWGLSGVCVDEVRVQGLCNQLPRVHFSQHPSETVESLHFLSPRSCLEIELLVYEGG